MKYFQRYQNGCISAMLGDRAILMSSIPTKGGWFLRNWHQMLDTLVFARLREAEGNFAERGAERDDGEAAGPR